jgi:tRNA U34 5-methylaminomethyl-2-thiouridine-forming methyltransferase MnmC
VSGGRYSVVELRAGVSAIRDDLSGEVMHPAVGPWAEANRLYVEQPGLAARLAALHLGPLRILDIGLGGAANAIAALEAHAQLAPTRARPLELVSFERDLGPLRLVVEQLAQFPFLAGWQEALRSVLERHTWSGPAARWTVHLGDVRERLSEVPAGAELIFHDPFSPKANEELWTPEFFAQLRERLSDDGLLVTYSGSTRTRVSLLLAGFFVGSGAPIGKKQETTVAARALAQLALPLGESWLGRWRRSTARAPWGRGHWPAVEARVEERLREHMSPGRSVTQS